MVNHFDQTFFENIYFKLCVWLYARRKNYRVPLIISREVYTGLLISWTERQKTISFTNFHDWGGIRGLAGMTPKPEDPTIPLPGGVIEQEPEIVGCEEAAESSLSVEKSLSISHLSTFSFSSFWQNFYLSSFVDILAFFTLSFHGEDDVCFEQVVLKSILTVSYSENRLQMMKIVW